MLLWWKLGPRGVGLWMSDSGVCVYLKGKKKRITQYNVWQSLPYTEQDRNESVSRGARKHHSPSKTMESEFSSLLTGHTKMLILDCWHLSTEDPALSFCTSLHWFFFFFLEVWQFALGKYKSIIISGPPLLWVPLNMLDFNRNSAQIPGYPVFCAEPHKQSGLWVSKYVWLNLDVRKLAWFTTEWNSNNVI